VKADPKDTQDVLSPASSLLDSPENSLPAPTIIVGLGNPILGDDGVGWKIAEQVQMAIADQPAYAHVVVESLSLGGLSLMEHLMGYERAIIIDAVYLNQALPGSLYSIDLNELPNLSSGHLTSTHDTSLQTALDVGRAMGAALPTDIHILGIESIRIFDFSEELTPEVSAAIPQAVQITLQLINDGGRNPFPKEQQS
jgi:hydrogenase maturation protease